MQNDGAAPVTTPPDWRSPGNEATRPDGAGPREGEGSPAVFKAVSLLDVLSRNRRPMALSDLARTAGLPKSSAHSLLASLETEGLVYRLGVTREYVLGSRILDLASRFLEGDALGALYADAAREFVEETGATVQMGRLEGTEVVYTARFEGRGSIQLSSRVGTRLHASTTAMGKAAMSLLDDGEIRHRYANAQTLPVETPRSISTLDGLIAELQQVRLRNGLAIDDEENGLGLRCYGVPLFEVTGLCYAASTTITATGHSRADEDRVIEALQRLRHRIVSHLPVPGDARAVAPPSSG
jgi:DNA-binding IclR family transcriptional regulator